eukprot:gene18127-23781_t
MPGTAVTSPMSDKSDGKDSNKTKIMEIFEFMKPIYYIHDAQVNQSDIQLAQQSWDIILDDKSPEYLKKKSCNEITAVSCLTWFYDCFYDRLFDIHPTCRSLFKNNMIVQGKALVKLITTALTMLNDLDNLVPVLINLAKSHTAKGILAYQYSIVGEVLLWTLKFCLGDAYTDNTKMSWLKIYSLMLSVILPVAIEEELISKGKETK